MIGFKNNNYRSQPLLLVWSFVLLLSCSTLLLLLLLSSCNIVEVEATIETAAAAEANTNKQQQQQQQQTGFKLSKWFDFEEYKRIYGKKYTSALQEMARMKLYLGGVLRVIIAAIKHRFFGKRYYLAVNRFTDSTEDEWHKEVLVDAALIKGEKIIGEDELNVDDKTGNGEKKQFDAAELSDIDTKLPEMFKGREATFQKFIDEMGDSQQQGDATVDGGDGERDHDKLAAPSDGNKLNVDMLFRPPTPAGSLVDAPLPKSNNPRYEEPQVMSQSSRGDLVERELDDQDTDDINQSKGIIDNVLDGINFLFSAAEQVAKQDEKKIELFSEGPDEIFVDHRQSGCLTRPSHQLECGSCYAFASMALYEFLYCTQQQQQQPVQFSPQYVIDCAPKRNEYLRGCKGGNPIKVAEFVNEFGLELEVNYPYAAEVQMCPYDEEEDSSKMGYIRVDEPGLQVVKPQDIDDMLKKQPVLISMFPNSELKAYGGGVYDNYACDYDYGHAMLLVGSGRKDNLEYWIIRNSLGAEWGEQGYLYMDKGAALNCLIEDGYISHAKFPSAKVNPKYTKKDMVKILPFKTESETKELAE